MDGEPPSTRVVVWLGHLLVLAGAVAGAIVALRVLCGGAAPPLHLALPRAFPFAAMSLDAVDGLAFFLLVVSLVAAAAAIYGPRTSARTQAPLRQTGALACSSAAEGSSVARATRSASSSPGRE
jgi:hypothetical protein